MSKIDLDPITSGYNLSKINSNFQKVEDELNNKVLYRDSPAGEPNSMSSNLDMNSKSILNANKISSNVLELGGVQIVPINLAADPYNGTREALRRSYAEAGYNLVDGSFEAGGTLVNANDVLLHEASGKGYTGPAGTVAAGTDPASVPYVDVSSRLLREVVINKSKIYLSQFFDKPYDEISYNDDATTPLRKAISSLKKPYVYTAGHTPDQAARTYYDDGGGGVVVIDCPCRITDTVHIPAFVRLAQVGSVTGGFGKRFDIQNLFTKPDNINPIYVDISDPTKIGLDCSAIHYQTGQTKPIGGLYESADIDNKIYLQSYGAGIIDLYVFTDKNCGMGVRMAGAQASSFSGVIRGNFDVGASFQSNWGSAHPYLLSVGSKTCVHYYNINSVEFGTVYTTPGSSNWTTSEPSWSLMANVGAPGVSHGIAGRACLSVIFTSLTTEGGQYGFYSRDSQFSISTLYQEVIADTCMWARNSSMVISSWRVGCPSAKVISASRRTFVDIQGFYTVSPSAQDYGTFIGVVTPEDGFTPQIKLRGTVRYPSVNDKFSPYLDFDNEKQFREIWVDPINGLDVNTGFGPDNPIKTLGALNNRLKKNFNNRVYLGGSVRGDGVIADAAVDFVVWADKAASASIGSSSNFAVSCVGHSELTISENVNLEAGGRAAIGLDGAVATIRLNGTMSIPSGMSIFSRSFSITEPNDVLLLIKTGSTINTTGAISLYDSGRTGFAIHRDMYAGPTSPVVGGGISLGGASGSSILKSASRLVP